MTINPVLGKTIHCMSFFWMAKGFDDGLVTGMI